LAGSADSLHVLEEVVGHFAALGIPYALGGSLASSLFGKPRFTEDADITVEPFPGKEAGLAARFGPDYYLSPGAIRQAVRDRTSFNIIHTGTGFKVDVFVRKDRAFDQSVMNRRRHVPLPDRPGQSIALVSAEDIILLKLEWYRLGGGISERQWADIRGVLQVQAGKLDDTYLDHWAAQLNVTDLLARARQEGSGPV
jgi:hypothetical protein